MDPNTTPKTSKQVISFLKSKGIDTELVRGKGYWYFWGETEMRWYSSSVSVYYITDLTLEQWLKAYKVLKNDYRNH